MTPFSYKCCFRNILSACAALAALAAFPGQAMAQQDAAAFEPFRAVEMKLARIGYRLTTANVALCDRLQPATGIQLHTLDQFDSGDRDAAKAYFGFASEVAIEGIVEGSPAEAAGLLPNDSILSIGPVVIADTQGEPGTTDRLVAVQLALADLPPDQPIAVKVMRNGEVIETVIHPVPACRSRFEIRFADDMDASADGTMVQVSSRFLEEYPESWLPPVVAHEFAHNVLHHRERLEERGVAWGMLSGFGGSVKYFRQSEIQADILSLSLLRNAGYDPAVSIAYWKSFGPKYAGGILRARTHPNWRDRVATMEHELARMETVSDLPEIPPILASRDRPLDGNWRAILIRH
ncbi:M48 family metallopeptidase [Sphingosinithalassobacter portus]|uniref:M48 family metallopeptidase n=1 Tax=Stakelama portus TaxID=2676234 RepID=UPI0011AB57D2|nr:M48 family metallopeptidase [Sphingosinithalassobacter portus]